MIDQIYNQDVDKAYKDSLHGRSLNVSRHYVAANHAIRHTAVIHLTDYMNNKGLEKNTDFIIASYIADANYYVSSSYSKRIQEYVQWIVTIRKNDYEKTIKLFKKMTVDDLIASLIHLWIDLLFLDYNSKDKKTHQFIVDKLTFTRKVLTKVQVKIQVNNIDKAYLTIMDVLWKELQISVDRLGKSKGEGGENEES